VPGRFAERRLTRSEAVRSTLNPIDFFSKRLGIVRDVMAALRVRRRIMGTLVFICPTTGDEVSTGIAMEVETFESLKAETVRCLSKLREVPPF
jgi:hypothetical protein